MRFECLQVSVVVQVSAGVIVQFVVEQVMGYLLYFFSVVGGERQEV